MNIDYKNELQFDNGKKSYLGLVEYDAIFAMDYSSKNDVFFTQFFCLTGDQNQGETNELGFLKLSFTLSKETKKLVVFEAEFTQELTFNSQEISSEEKLSSFMRLVINRWLENQSIDQLEKISNSLKKDEIFNLSKYDRFTLWDRPCLFPEEHTVIEFSEREDTSGKIEFLQGEISPQLISRIEVEYQFENDTKLVIFQTDKKDFFSDEKLEEIKPFRLKSLVNHEDALAIKNFLKF